MQKKWLKSNGLWQIAITLLFLLATNANAEIVITTNKSEDDKVIQQQFKESQQQKVNSTTPSDVSSRDNNSEIIQRDIPTLNQPIIDQASLLSTEQNLKLSQYIQQIYQFGKAQIGIVIVPTTGQEDIFDFSMRVAEKWQLGSKEQDNGLLITVAINDHRIQMLTGYGLEGVLPDIVTHRIIQNNIAPYFKQQQYTQGLQSGLQEIDRILSLDPDMVHLGKVIEQEPVSNSKLVQQQVKIDQSVQVNQSSPLEDSIATIFALLIILVPLFALAGKFCALFWGREKIAVYFSIITIFLYYLLAKGMGVVLLSSWGSLLCAGIVFWLVGIPVLSKIFPRSFRDQDEGILHKFVDIDVISTNSHNDNNEESNHQPKSNENNFWNNRSKSNTSRFLRDSSSKKSANRSEHVSSETSNSSNSSSSSFGGGNSVHHDDFSTSSSSSKSSYKGDGGRFGGGGASGSW